MTLPATRAERLEVITTPFGRFQIDPLDLIGSTLKAGTLWDGPGFLQPIAREYGRLGERGITILDVGANLGAFSVWLAQQGAWRVVAVEPIPQTMQQFKANLDLNQAVTGDRVIPIQVAAYDRTCRMRLADPLDEGNPGGASVRPDSAGDIRAVALDDYAFLWTGGVSLIVVDAQGCDGRVIRGLRHTIVRWRPTIVFEWDEALARRHGDTLEKPRRMLQVLGYDVEEWPEYPNNYLAVYRRVEGLR